MKKLNAVNIHTKLAFFILWLYMWLVFSLQTISKLTIYDNFTLGFSLLLGFLSFSVAFAVIQYLPPLISSPPEVKPGNRHSIVIGLSAALITFLVFEMYHSAQYPGGMSPDTLEQYSQALGESAYNDWHPVLHTLLYFTLPLKAGGSLDTVVSLQLLYFSLACGYLVYILFKNGCNTPFAAFISFYIWLNPYLAAYLMYPWKDMAMMTFAIILVGYYTQILCTDGEWLENKFNLLLFSALSVLCGFMRHNAVLFVAPLVLIVLFYCLRDWKRRVAIIALITLFFSGIKLTFAALDVEEPNRRVLETVGLPATIWCNVMKECPGQLPEDTRDYLYSLISYDDAYNEYYITGSFNSIKWAEISGKKAIDIDKIDALSYAEVLKITYQCFRYAPKASLLAATYLTDIVWGIDGKYGKPSISIVNNDWDIMSSPGADAGNAFTLFNSFFYSGFGCILFGSFGFMLLVMLTVSVCLLAKRRFAFIHIIPLFCYDFGTMLLLSGNDYRFFIVTTPLWLPTIFLMLKDKRKIPLHTRQRRNGFEGEI